MNMRNQVDKKDSFFEEDIVMQLKQLFADLKNDVELIVHVGSNHESEELKQYAWEISCLTPHLFYSERELLQCERPFVELKLLEEEYSGIRFHLVPGGNEFTAFIMAIYNLAGKGQLVDDHSLQGIRSIDKPCHLKIFVTPSCELCQQLVISAVRIATLHPLIQVDIYNIEWYPEYKKEYEINGVPAFLINGSAARFGRRTVAQLLSDIHEEEKKEAKSLASQEQDNLSQMVCQEDACALPMPWNQEEDLRIMAFNSMLNLFENILYINLERGTYLDISSEENIEGHFTGWIKDYFSQYIADYVSPDYVEELKEFLNLQKLQEKMRSGNNLTIEYKDHLSSWWRAIFLPAKYQQSGNIREIIFCRLDIGHSKKKESLMQKKLQKAQETVEELTLDPLTELLVRRSGEEQIRKAINMQSYGTLCLFDCDHFKHYNDSYGHAAGDQVLRQIGNVIKKTLRENDIAVRPGGDEFMFYAPGLVERKALDSCLNRLFGELNKIELTEINGESIEISVGAVIYDGKEEENFESLYKKADRATYLSKQIKGNHYTLLG